MIKAQLEVREQRLSGEPASSDVLSEPTSAQRQRATLSRSNRALLPTSYINMALRNVWKGLDGMCGKAAVQGDCVGPPHRSTKRGHSPSLGATGRGFSSAAMAARTKVNFASEPMSFWPAVHFPASPPGK